MRFVAVTPSSLPEARTAYERHDWRAAVAVYRQSLEAGENLVGPDLERLGKACWWIGDREGCLDAHERAYGKYLEEGDRRRAAKCAQMLRFNYVNGLGDRETGLGWSAKAAKLLAGLDECAEHGYQIRLDARKLCTTGHREEGLPLYDKALEIGRRLDDPDLVALTESWKSLDLIDAGRAEEGFALVDEVCAAAVGGELGAWATGIVLCNAISAYRDSADYAGAGEWAERAARWCERQSIHGFPGICRVRRAEVLRLRGAWVDAEKEARAAGEELERFLVEYAAQAYLELGEIRLRLGDHVGAEAAFRQVHALGTDPQPGQGLLMLARGEPEAAARGLRRALENVDLVTVERARILEALVEAESTFDQAGSETTASELENIAASNPRPALRAMALRARGSIDVAAGKPATAALRQALQLWRSLDAPYEVARTRVLLAASYQLEGDAEGAHLELDAAALAFDRLGAAPDVAHVNEKIANLPGAQPATTRRAFLFSDIVDSTKLAETLGDETWAELLRWHDAALRGLFAQHRGDEVDHAGDGFLVAFESSASAIACATAMQRMLAAHRRDHGFAPRIRVGVHASDAVRSGRGFRGSGVHQAARIAALARADEVFASAVAAGEAGIPVSEPQAVKLKGFARPVEVVAIAWR
jgi:class 3 adenylate cyclase